MSATTEKAILAGGCFWGMQDLIRKRPGVITTRVGYTGGDVANATYRNHGTHAEAIEITFDPDGDLVPGASSSSSSRSTTRRPRTVRATTSGLSYRSAIFYVDDEQTRVAEDTIADVEASGLWPGKVVTEVAPGGTVLGGRARAPGLPGALPQRVHVPLPSAGVGPAPAQRRPRRVGRQPWPTNRSTRRSEPSGDGCVECLAADGWWFHLRRCAGCGHVGCCDSSPSQHASKHARQAGPLHRPELRAG